MESPEVLILFDVTKVAFRLDRPCLTLQDPFFTLDVFIGFLFQLFPKCFPVLFQNRDQRVVISPVAADITVDNEIVLYCDLDIV